MRLAILIIIGLVVGGCTNLQPKPETAQVRTPDQYYVEARQAQARGEHQQAINYFTDLETRYPLSPYSQLAAVESAYAYFRLGDLDQAISEADRFISTNPGHKSLDYAYYLKGLAMTGQGIASTSGTAELIDPWRTREAFKVFAQLAHRFPDSKYRESATQQMAQIRNHLARHELKAVHTSLDKGDQTEALKRAKYISKNYPETPAAAEAIDLISQQAVRHITPSQNSSVINGEPAEPKLDKEHAQRELWLLQQNPTFYTLQIAATSSRDELESFIDRHHLASDTTFYTHKLGGSSWFALLFGNYRDWNTAISAAEQLKQQLGIDNIWIRQFDEVQSTILSQR